MVVHLQHIVESMALLELVAELSVCFCDLPALVFSSAKPKSSNCLHFCSSQLLSLHDSNLGYLSGDNKPFLKAGPQVSG